MYIINYDIYIEQKSEKHIYNNHQVLIGTLTISGIWLKDCSQMNILICPSLSFYSSNIIQRDIVRCKYFKDQSPSMKAWFWCKALWEN